MSLSAAKLRLLIVTGPLHPLIGGLETAVDVLAGELVALGQEVIVVTLTPSNAPDASAYGICRRPSLLAHFRLFMWADCVLVQGLILKMAWPQFFFRSRMFVTHQGMYPSGQRFGWLRDLLSKRVTHVAISHAVGATLPTRYELIYNPYAAETFYPRQAARRPRSLIFVGRLVPEKGAATLLEAVASLRRAGFECTLTIAGEGPQRLELEALIQSHDLAGQVFLAGSVVGDALAELFSAHQVAVVPSLWPEPLGIVALEAIACGCHVIGTSQGGLPEAIGDCGVVVPNGDVAALAQAIEDALSAPPDEAAAARRLKHLGKFQPRAVAQRYLDLFRQGGLAAVAS